MSFYNPSPHPRFINSHSLHFVSFPLIQNSHPVFIFVIHGTGILENAKIIVLQKVPQVLDLFDCYFMMRYRLSLLTNILHSPCGDMTFGYPIIDCANQHLGKVVCQSSPL